MAILAYFRHREVKLVNLFLSVAVDLITATEICDESVLSVLSVRLIATTALDAISQEANDIFSRTPRTCVSLNDVRNLGGEVRKHQDRQYVKRSFQVIMFRLQFHFELLNLLDRHT